MKTRIAFIVVLVLAGSGQTATAQVRSQPPSVLSPSVLKAMTAQKPKSKTPLTARLGVIQRARAATPAPSAKRGATAVREIPLKSGK